MFKYSEDKIFVEASISDPKDTFENQTEIPQALLDNYLYNFDEKSSLFMVVSVHLSSSYGRNRIYWTGGGKVDQEQQVVDE
jgi:hypothetical protein